MPFQMTKQEALALVGAKRGAQQRLAALLEVDKSTVSRWPHDAPIPREHALSLRFEHFPQAFGDPTQPA